MTAPHAPDPFLAMVLGFVQGVTEFLPVSSSGHVAISGVLFGASSTPLSFIVALHAGTLIGTVLALRSHLTQIAVDTWRGLRDDPRAFLRTESGQEVWAVTVATIPTGCLGLLLADRIELLSRDLTIVGLCLLGSAVLVLSTRLGGGESNTLNARSALLVGLAQSAALLPGISRSGSTIAAAMRCGVNGPSAFRFSFLLSLPTIAGAVLLELGSAEGLARMGRAELLGGITAMAVGYGSYRLLGRLVERGRFWAFAIYLVPVGFWTAFFAV
ncbi:MAG: undecaprenyl-diphosphate phosphatase [Planctomycetota bacterium]